MKFFFYLCVVVRLSMSKSDIGIKYSITLANTTTDGKLPSSIVCKCWWCHIKTDEDNIIGCPLSYNKQTNTIYNEGVFCSMSCVKAYILSSKDVKYRSSLQLLYSIANTTDITAAPHFTMLKDYLGPLSLEEYRQTRNLYIPSHNNYNMVYSNNIYDVILRL